MEEGREEEMDGRIDEEMEGWKEVGREEELDGGW